MAQHGAAQHVPRHLLPAEVVQPVPELAQSARGDDHGQPAAVQRAAQRNRAEGAISHLMIHIYIWQNLVC